MKVYILAAGQGLRLWPYNENRIKTLMPISGQPIIAHTVERLIRQGMTEIVIGVRKQKRRVTLLLLSSCTD
ncbi:NTP transferase domain-containing protein [Vibrio sp. SS-MA-C1-2]|uniref:sugar phosphate nucleotidyltransferase n=1 Tax=Vibrio sp. SS-MA-C1-2 TaxID=2908646 RepID=UPI001F43CB5D|nr:sugar phosphate nucleotidyltransferase [Vibrio sp. SS-MA-C1-2]UJF18499.1 NTP transferase domain-containing protein [Vibrio sp. SS-MA-C1-2]